MIEVKDIRVWEDMPGVAGKYTLEVRIIDHDKGTHISNGMELWNWDKCFSYNADDLDRISDLAGERLTELLND